MDFPWDQRLYFSFTSVLLLVKSKTSVSDKTVIISCSVNPKYTNLNLEIMLALGLDLGLGLTQVNINLI